MQTLRSFASAPVLGARRQTACKAVCAAGVRPMNGRVGFVSQNSPVAPGARPHDSTRQVACKSSDVPVTQGSLGSSAGLVRNLAFISFWLQLPLSIVSGCILVFAINFSSAPGDVTRWFTLVGVIFAFISTFFADAFLRLARRALDKGEPVQRSFFLQNLVRNTNINLAGIGITLIGLQASVGTLVTKTMLGAANAPYATPQPGSTLVSLDVFSLQASTNTLLAHFLSIVFANFILGVVSKIGAAPQPAT